MNKFFRNKPLAITVISVIILISLLVFTAGGGLGSVSSTLGGVFTPVGSFFSGVVNSVGDFFGGIFGGGTQAEVAKLEEKVALLDIQNQGLLESEKENQRLKELLDYEETLTKNDTVFAKVISKEPGYMFDVFVINVGYNQGVRKDMAVVNADGLVGRISEVGGNWSQVIAVIDSRSAISVMVERTRDHGVINGTTQMDDVCTMSYLPVESNAAPGDTIITSGLDGVFPKGIAIGEVTEVSTKDNQLEKVATVKPYVDFYHVEEVLVVMPTDETDTASGSNADTQTSAANSEAGE